MFTTESFVCCTTLKRRRLRDRDLCTRLFAYDRSTGILFDPAELHTGTPQRRPLAARPRLLLASAGYIMQPNQRRHDGNRRRGRTAVPPSSSASTSLTLTAAAAMVLSCLHAGIPSCSAFSLSTSTPPAPARRSSSRTASVSMSTSVPRWGLGGAIGHGYGYGHGHRQDAPSIWERQRRVPAAHVASTARNGRTRMAMSTDGSGSGSEEESEEEEEARAEV